MNKISTMDKTELKKLITFLKTLKVLYVEDNYDSRTQALKMLENYFSDIDIAVDGSDGLSSYENYYSNTNRYYDVVITDIKMPKMDGIEMSKAIQNINKKQKIIVVSAYEDKEYFIELINMGIDGFIQKPLFFEEVLEAFSQLSKNVKNNACVTLGYKCTYNKISKKLYCDGEEIYLTINEYKFMEFLIQNYNTVTNLEDIFNHIFYDEPFKDFTTDSIKGLIKRLRKKLPENLIINNRTTGYSITMD